MHEKNNGKLKREVELTELRQTQSAVRNIVVNLYIIVH